MTSAELSDVVIVEQVRGVERVERLAAEGVEPQRTWVDEGYLQELRARVTWSKAHRY